MKSTIENPLAFFEYISLEINFNTYINDNIVNPDVLKYRVENFETIYYSELNEYNEPKEHSIKLKTLLNPHLKRELENSKRYLKDFYMDNPPLKTQNHLEYQFNTLQNIIDKNYLFINKYPYLILALRGAINFINYRINPDREKFHLNEDKLKLDFSGEELVERKNIKFIHEIFDYMKGQNQKNEIILNEDDFNSLINYTLHLIEKEEVPEIEHKIKPNLNNGIILFCYWVLHKELYTTTRIKNIFPSFIKALFINFNNSEKSSIKNQLGTKSRFYPYSFLPKIILDYLD